MDLLVLGADEVDALLDADALLGALAEAFTALSAGRTSVPPRVAARASRGFLAAMPGYVEGVALETKLVSVFPGNHGAGLPAHQAVIVMFDEATGTPEALMDGTVITARRTAAASALSIRLLARHDALAVAILGAGVQGKAHLDAVARVLPGASDVRVASRSGKHARALAECHERARMVVSFEEAVTDADVVCLCTDSPEPVIERGWLRPGAHVTSVGASREGPEVDAATVRAATIFVESRVAVQPYPAGAHELQGMDPARVRELGEVIAGARPGRSRDDELTLYKSMGHAVEDAAAAALVLGAARAEGRGLVISL